VAVSVVVPPYVPVAAPTARLVLMAGAASEKFWTVVPPFVTFTLLALPFE
jgi:hypothetical protein